MFEKNHIQLIGSLQHIYFVAIANQVVRVVQEAGS